jgi:NADH:ubiquinone oxidoreductase subunit F (NADH-binding)
MVVTDETSHEVTISPRRTPARRAMPHSFFHLEHVALVDQACQGTACFLARHRDPATWARTAGESPRVHCLGRCYAAPATAADTTRPHVEAATPTPVLLERIVADRGPSLTAYLASGGYTGLETALRVGSTEVVDRIDRSGLRGRGGAAFPVGRKWRAVIDQRAPTAYVVCNADEGDPGGFIDRVLLEDDAHAVIEGLAIAALATGARKGFVYVRKEYPQARITLQCAVDEARAAGIVGTSLLGDGPPFDLEVVEGQGSYVCGEETALLNALEGRRPDVRSRPPYPSERGLFGAPTVVNNVETLAAVPWIVSHGADDYRAIGTNGSRGTKLVSLSSSFARPGLYEVDLGTPVRDIVERLGGGITGCELRGVLVGGPLAGVLPPHLLDTSLDFEAMRRVGCEVGHGGVVAIDEHTSIPELVHHVFRFGAYESCGKCTPCRVGAAWVEAMFAKPAALETPSEASAHELHSTVEALAATSLCGHGSGLAAFARSVLTHYGEEIDRWLG